MENSKKDINENVKADAKDDVKEEVETKVEEGIKENDSDLVDISDEIKSDTSEGGNKDADKPDPGRTFQVRKKKKWVRVLVIILIIAAVIGFIVYKSVQTANKLKEAMQGSTQESEIQRMDISSTISTTGTIQSKDVRTLTSPLSGVKIDEVNYKVGDMVEQGAVVVTFSREDIIKHEGSAIALSFDAQRRYECFLGYRERYEFSCVHCKEAEEKCKTFALKAALSTITALEAGSGTIGEKEKNDLFDFLHNLQGDIKYLDLKNRLLLWGFNNCSAVNTVYGKLSLWSKKVK